MDHIRNVIKDIITTKNRSQYDPDRPIGYTVRNVEVIKSSQHG